MTKPLASLAIALTATVSGWALLCQPSAETVTVAAQRQDGGAFILFDQGTQSSIMSGSTDDMARARAARSGSEAMLYLRQDGRSYVVRDAETLRRAQAIFAPQREMGDRQAALGERQAALGERQATLGEQQARLGMRQASLGTNASADLGTQQAALGRQQDELGRQQDALGQQQGVLGHEQERLGRIAQQQFHALAAEAIRSGTARRVD